MKKIVLFILLVFITISQYGCTKDDSYNGYKEPIEENQYKMLIKNLEDRDFNVEEKDGNNLEDHILRGKPKWIKIKGDHIYIYLYEDNEKMEADISNLSEDGFTYSNNEKGITMDWIYPPHYFKKENMVVLYVGEDMEIINALEDILGSKFIGQTK
ncbi:MAG: hypothetical protein ACTHW2_10390 [Tissierella sp.]|uniref:hypothetical protein n=1 Tax=Tissierella sp. TaxID=41274 RepID=UPI003F969250